MKFVYTFTKIDDHQVCTLLLRAGWTEFARTRWKVFFKRELLMGIDA